MRREGSFQELAHTVAHRLNQKYQDQPLAISYAWWMLETITAQPKAALIATSTLTLSHQEEEKLDIWINEQLQHHRPLQYLIGTVPFGECTIAVAPPTLIPRPETEEWCYTLINSFQKLPQRPLRILDIGTGSGCIAIALARALPTATLYAVDISSDALALAAKNAALNKVPHITFLQSNLFDALPADISFDLIVANPPYIAAEEWDMLDKSVQVWEDKGALIAPDNGLAIVKKIIETAPLYITPNHHLKAQNIPQLVIEIGYKQGPTVASLFQAAHFDTIKVEKDLAGNDRIVMGNMPYEIHSLP